MANKKPPQSDGGRGSDPPSDGLGKGSEARPPSGGGSGGPEPENKGLPFEFIPDTKIPVVRVTADKLTMLATARRNRMSDATWAAISGFAASLPASIHDLIDAYVDAAPATRGLALGRLIDVAVTVGFFAFMLVAFFIERGKSSQEILREILNPGSPPSSKKWWEFWKS